MKLSFLQKILALPFFVLVAFVVILLVNKAQFKLNNTVSIKIEQEHFPELLYSIKQCNLFDGLQRSLQDAVTASDDDLLIEADSIMAEIVQCAYNENIHAHSDESDFVPDVNRLEDYYAAARKLSQRMIDGDMSDGMIISLKEMGTRYTDLKEALRKHHLDHEKTVTQAFIDVRKSRSRSLLLTLLTIVVSMILLSIATMFLIFAIRKPIFSMIEVSNAYSAGDRQIRNKLNGHDEIDLLAFALNDLMDKAMVSQDKIHEQNLLKNGQTELSDIMWVEQKIEAQAGKILQYLVNFTNTQRGILYMPQKDGHLEAMAKYGFMEDESPTTAFFPGSGLKEKSAKDQKTVVIENLPASYPHITLGSTTVAAKSLLLTPLVDEGRVIGLVELVSINDLEANAIEFMEIVAPNMAVNLKYANARLRTDELLQQTQQQAEELNTTSKELLQKNIMLEKQSNKLEQSYLDINQKNSALEEAASMLGTRAEELEKTNRYRSEFIANMSHELRTPLNSIMVLSQLIAEDCKSKLNPKHLKFANSINESGNELLSLVNDVLDQAKIDSGKLDVYLESIGVEDIIHYCKNNFQHQTEIKGLRLELNVSEFAAEFVYSDILRLQQILKNLFSNAIKFTQKGAINISISNVDPDIDLSKSGLIPEKSIAISVHDNGIGIPKKQQQVIFESFQQADGTISRRYGGTGLGLSISAKLVKLLGGEIQLESQEGAGACFTVFLPTIEGEKHKTGNVFKATFDPIKKDVGISLDEDLYQEIDEYTEKSKKIAGRKILILENDLRFAFSISAELEERGLLTRIARSADECLNILDKQADIDLLIVDLQVPEMDYYKLCKTIWNLEGFGDLPLIVLSANQKDKEFKTHQNTSKVEFFVKPVNTEKLILLVQDLIGS
jgi:two-component system, chemotaxis family, sensor kinase CheA